MPDTRPKWEPGWNGADTPYDYGWMRATEDRSFTPDVQFTSEEFAEYKEGYNAAMDGWGVM